VSVRLSICIATFNRAAFIGETLDNLVQQATDEVEILVVDGASTDNTEEVVRAYLPRCPRLRYVRLSAKGGVDQDYNRSVELAQGEYCWLFSDDDLLKPGAVQTMLNEIKHGYSLILVNSEAQSADLSTMQQVKVLQAATRVYSPEELERLFVDTAKYLTFIGCVVIKREVWLARDRERYFGSAFIHVGVIFQRPLPANALAIAEPWIIIRYGNASWTARAFDIWMVQWPRLIWSFPHFADASKRRICRKEPWRSKMVMFLTRAVAGFSIDIYRQKYEPLLPLRSDRIAAQLIARLPGVLVNFIVIVGFKLFRRYDQLMQVNLRNSPFYYQIYLRRLFRRS